MLRRSSILARITGGGLGLAALSFSIASSGIEWKTPPGKITLLAVNAHPDDEGIFFGGALPYYAGVLQVPTMLLSMTSGDWQPTNLLIRENELRNASWIYGLRYEPLFPRFRDVPSHSISNPYPNKIDATWDYWADGILQGDGSDVAQGKARAINYVAEVIRRYQPEVIITHDLNGEYGHDNHKATALAVGEAYLVAADPLASAPNLASLPPWRARKLYLHLYPTNSLFHTEWETPRDEFGGKSARQVANDGLDAHISQNSPDVSTFYLSNENYNGHDSERWGLYATTVGPDTIGEDGIARGTFLENLNLANGVNRPPEFFPKPVRVPPAQVNQPYSGHTLARFATDPDKVSGDMLTFTKLSGPSWLNIASNGALSGTPPSTSTGENLFHVRVNDSSSAYDEAMLRIVVGGPLAASWNFNDASGTIVNDSSGEEHHATLMNATSVTPGRDKGALLLTGSTGYAVSDNVNLGNAITVSAWICSSNLVGPRAIVGEAGGYSLKTSERSLQFTIPGIRDHTYAANLATGNWYHVAVTFEAGVTNGCRFYVNGGFRAALNASTKNSSANVTWIGRNQWGQYYSGLLDDVRIYRVALSAGDIASLYTNRLPSFDSNPIVGVSAVENRAYSSETLASRASDPDYGDTLFFRKISGPEWLLIATNGTLAGMPRVEDVGTNKFRIQVRDQHQAAADAVLRILVAYQPDLKLRVTELKQGRASLVFTGKPEQNYEILGSADLMSWSPLQTLLTDSLGQLLWTDTVARTNGYFYRIRE